MRPNTLYSLVALALAGLVTARPLQSRQEGVNTTTVAPHEFVEIVDPNDPDAETYVEFVPEASYVEFEDEPEGEPEATPRKRSLASRSPDHVVPRKPQTPCSKLAVRKEWYVSVPSGFCEGFPDLVDFSGVI